MTRSYLLRIAACLFVIALYGSARTTNARTQGVVNVLDYGADPTGTSDSCPAFGQAIAAYTAANYSNKQLVIPDGVYLTSCPLGFTNENVNIRGGSPATTQIRTSGTNSAITVSNAGFYSRVDIRGLSIKRLARVNADSSGVPRGS